MCFGAEETCLDTSIQSELLISQIARCATLLANCAAAPWKQIKKHDARMFNTSEKKPPVKKLTSLNARAAAQKWSNEPIVNRVRSSLVALDIPNAKERGKFRNDGPTSSRAPTALLSVQSIGEWRPIESRRLTELTKEFISLQKAMYSKMSSYIIGAFTSAQLFLVSRPSCPWWVQAELPLVPLEPALLVERRLPELQQCKRTGKL